MSVAGNYGCRHWEDVETQPCSVGLSVIVTAVAEPYDAFMCAHSLLAHTDSTVIVNNEGLYDIRGRNLDVERTHQTEQLARAVRLLIDDISCFDGRLNADAIEFQTNSVVYPCIHFMLCSYTPSVSTVEANHELLSVTIIAISVIESA